MTGILKITLDGGTTWVPVAMGPPGPTGPTGPANTLTKGTVTTGAPGTAADFTITGTPPNQILNMTIPRGDTGGIQRVYYGSGAVPARPAGATAGVEWVGTANPTANMVAGDTWLSMP